MSGFDLATIAHVLGVPSCSSLPINSVQVDSRHVSENDLFFALPGNRVDGHSYLPQVAGIGAKAAVVNNTYSGSDYGLMLLRVADPLVSLQCLARHVLQERNQKIIAITGSVGKTSTKEFLASLLRQKYRVGASRTNHNSQIGLPLTILNDTTPNDEVLVLEMGMTAPGHLSQLLTIAAPEIAVLTTVALVHAGAFNSIDHVARTKAEIFAHPRTSLGILDRDISNFDEIATSTSCAKISFSTKNRLADYFLDSTNTLICEEGSYPLGSIQHLAPHHRHNLLAAILVARKLNVAFSDIIQAIPSLQLPDRRMQHVPKSGVLFVNDSYNACDVSVKAALACLPAPSAGSRRIAVLGTMPDLGKFCVDCHTDVGHYALDKVDHLFCFGKECEPMIDIWQQHGRAARLFTDRAYLVRALEKFLQAGDVVLLKGANSKKMWEILDEITLSG